MNNTVSIHSDIKFTQVACDKITCPSATIRSSTFARTAKFQRPPITAIFSACKEMRSFGRAAEGNFIERMAESKNRVPGVPAAPAIPAIWASASVKRTPGTMGSSGKWPRKKGSSPEKTFTPVDETPGTNVCTASTNTKGSRCGSPNDTGSITHTACVECPGNSIFLL